jgi:hypothetical protein
MSEQDRFPGAAAFDGRRNHKRAAWLGTLPASMLSK